jgi:hypothetical protein
VRLDEDQFDVLEDPSDQKCLELVAPLSNMSRENVGRVLCYLEKSKECIQEMHDAGTPHIKVEWQNNIGHNPIGKSIK